MHVGMILYGEHSAEARQQGSSDGKMLEASSACMILFSLECDAHLYVSQCFGIQHNERLFE